MEKIECSIVKDLLPLYVDGVVSEETSQIVKAHIECCDNCRKDYETLSKDLILPSNQTIQTEDSKMLKKFKKSWKLKKIIIACISTLLTILVIFTGYTVYQNVPSVHDYFSPITTVILRDMRTSDEWQQLHFDNGNYLNFDSIFYSKEAVNDANSEAPVELRISDKERNIIIDDLIIQPGEIASLSSLKNNQEYIVEYRTTADFILVRFR